MIRIIQKNNFLEYISSPHLKYGEENIIAVLLIPKKDNIKVPIDLGHEKELETGIIWVMIKDNYENIITPGDYMYLGKNGYWTSIDEANKYLDHIEKRLLEFNKKKYPIYHRPGIVKIINFSTLFSQTKYHLKRKHNKISYIRFSKDKI